MVTPRVSPDHRQRWVLPTWSASSAGTGSGGGFAFASIELVGTAAGECKDPQTMVPKAINSVIWRIGLFYVGSVVLLVLLLPWNAYQAGQSPLLPSSPNWACRISAVS